MTSRRTFLKTTTLAALAPAGGALAQAGSGHIDAHVHVWTPDTERYPLAEGSKASMKPNFSIIT